MSTYETPCVKIIDLGREVGVLCESTSYGNGGSMNDNPWEQEVIIMI